MKKGSRLYFFSYYCFFFVGYDRRPDEKGIKTENRGSIRGSGWGYDRRPDEKGIKTGDTVSNDADRAVTTEDLMKKGSRQHGIVQIGASKLVTTEDLMKKGSRPRHQQWCRTLLGYDRRPDEKGIKTLPRRTGQDTITLRPKT